MSGDTEQLRKILGQTTEDRLQNFIGGKIDLRIKELRERQEKLNKELAAIEHELELLSQHANGGDDGPSIQEVLSKLLKEQ